MRTFQGLCKKYEIPLPLFHARELEHFNQCKMCRQLWLMYVYFNEKSLKEKGDEWLVTTEADRQLLFKKLLKRQNKLFTSLRKRRNISAYVVFVQEQHRLLQDKSFEERQRTVKERWPLVDRKPYQLKADKLNAQRPTKKDLPRYMRIMFKTFCKTLPLPRKPKRPLNKFFEALLKAWRSYDGPKRWSEFKKEFVEQWNQQS